MIAQGIVVEYFDSNPGSEAVGSELTHHPISSHSAVPSASLVGKSRAFTHIIGLIERIAPTDKTVLISGPTGAGKEVIAQYIHRLRHEQGAPFLDLNCGAIPEHLFEAELFGHVRGAFTGANTDRAGFFEAVGSGTLFLDEIAELPYAMQAKLLRALETRQFRPVGANDLATFTGRIIAATHKNLAALVEEGRFREDLYHRLAVFELRVPPLSERKDDIPALLEHFVATQSRKIQFSTDAMQRLMQYAWPGNARELRNLIDRLCILVEQPLVTAEVLEPFLRSDSRLDQNQELARKLMQLEGQNKLLATEQLLIDYAMDQCESNKSQAAAMLGVNRKVIERRLSQRNDILSSSVRLIEEGHALVVNGLFAQALPLLHDAAVHLTSLNDSQSVHKELFQTYQLLGLCYRGTQGWLNSSATHFHELALEIGRDWCENAELASIQFGLWVSRLMMLELTKARSIAQDMILRARAMDDPGVLLDEGRVAMANALFWLGEFSEAQQGLQETSFYNLPGALRTGTQSFDIVGLSLTFDGLSAFQLGNFARAMQCLKELELKSQKETQHLFNKAILLQGAAWLNCVMGNFSAMAPQAKELERISSENNFVFYQGLGQIFYAAAQGHHGDCLQAEDAIRKGHENFMVKNGGCLFQSMQAWRRGELLLKAGQYQACIELLENAIKQAIAKQERAYLCELMTIKARAVYLSGDKAQGEMELHSAATMATALNSVPAQMHIQSALADIYAERGDSARTVAMLEDITARAGAVKGIAFIDNIHQKLQMYTKQAQ